MKDTTFPLVPPLLHVQEARGVPLDIWYAHASGCVSLESRVGFDFPDESSKIDPGAQGSDVFDIGNSIGGHLAGVDARGNVEPVEREHDADQHVFYDRRPLGSRIRLV